MIGGLRGAFEKARRDSDPAALVFFFDWRSIVKSDDLCMTDLMRLESPQVRMLRV
jgi:hypothetical protein